MDEQDGDLKVYTVAKISEMFEVSTYTVREWLRDGRLVGFKTGDSDKAAWRVTHEELVAFTKRRYHVEEKTG